MEVLGCCIPPGDEKTCILDLEDDPGTYFAWAYLLVSLPTAFLEECRRKAFGNVKMKSFSSVDIMWNTRQ